MDKYIMAVLTLMPGFLAINTAEKLGKTHTKKTGGVGHITTEM